MRCSECSAHVKPIVVWDVDGTMAQYHETFAPFACMYHDRTMPPEPYDGSVDMEVWLGLTREEHREAKLAYRQSGLKRSLPPYDKATWCAAMMKAVGAELWVATTRPWSLLSNIDSDTREWLRRYGVEPDGLLYGDDKYDRLVEQVDPERVLIVVEDLGHLIDRAMELGLPAFQIYRPHNEANRRTPGGTIDDVHDLFWSRLEEWRSEHER